MTELGDPTVILLALATFGNGLLAGLSLNKSIVELPAGKRMGSVAFAEYSRAADLRNGVAFYAALGIGSPIVTIVATAMVALDGPVSSLSKVVAVSAILFSAAHMLTTAGAAPHMVRIGRLGSDQRALDEEYDRFRAWHSARTVLQVGSFGMVVILFAILL